MRESIAVLTRLLLANTRWRRSCRYPHINAATVKKTDPLFLNQYSLTEKGKLNFRCADLNGCVLCNINLREAVLVGTSFTYANLP